MKICKILYINLIIISMLVFTSIDVSAAIYANADRDSAADVYVYEDFNGGDDRFYAEGLGSSTNNTSSGWTKPRGWNVSSSDGYFGWMGSQDDGFLGFSHNSTSRFNVINQLGNANPDMYQKNQWINVDWMNFDGTIVLSYDLLTPSSTIASGSNVGYIKHYFQTKSYTYSNTIITCTPRIYVDASGNVMTHCASNNALNDDDIAYTNLNPTMSAMLATIDGVSPGDWISIQLAITRDGETGRYTVSTYINGKLITNASQKAVLGVDPNKGGLTGTESGYYSYYEHKVEENSVMEYEGIGLHHTAYTLKDEWQGYDNICYRIYGDTYIDKKIPINDGDTEITVPFYNSAVTNSYPGAPIRAKSGIVDTSESDVSAVLYSSDDALMNSGNPCSDITIKQDKSTRIIEYPEQKETSVCCSGEYMILSGIPHMNANEKLVITVSGLKDISGKILENQTFVVYDSSSDKLGFIGIDAEDVFGNKIGFDENSNITSTVGTLSFRSIDDSDKGVKLLCGGVEAAIANFDDGVYSFDFRNATLKPNTEYTVIYDGAPSATFVTDCGVVKYGEFEFSGNTAWAKYVNTTENDSTVYVVGSVYDSNGNVSKTVCKSDVLPKATYGTVKITGLDKAGEKKAFIWNELFNDIADDNSSHYTLSSFDAGNIAEITGYTDRAYAGKNVKICVLKSGFENAENITEMVVCADEVQVGDNGSYKAGVNFSDMQTSKYVFAVTIDGKTYMQDKLYSTKADNADALKKLNNAKSAEEVSEIISNYALELEFDYHLYDSLDKSAVAAFMYKYIDAKRTENVPAFADKETSVAAFREFSVIEAITEGKVESFADVSKELTIVKSEPMKKWFNGQENVSSTRTESWQNDVYTRLKNCKFADYDDFNNKMMTSMVFAIVYNPESVASLKQMFTDFEKTFDFDLTTVTTDSVRILAQKNTNYTGFDLSELKADLKMYSTQDSGSGSSSSGNNRKYNGGNVTVPITSNPNQVLPSDGNRFIDLSEVPWAEEAITFLSRKNIVNGKSEGVFAPNDNITREEFVKMIISTLGLADSVNVSTMKFADIAKDSWYHKYISIAYSNNIINGISNDEFGTGCNITRQDMAVIICNALKYKNFETDNDFDISFNDKDSISDYALNSVAYLCERGVINGFEDNTFRANGFATRAQAAKVLYGLFNDLK